MRHRSFQLGMLLTLLCVGGLVLSAIHFSPTLKSRVNEMMHGELSQQITTATGGEITLKSGTIITFPPNALDKDTVVTVRELPSTEMIGKGPTDADLIAPAIDVMLNGTQLRAPVTVTFSLTTGIPDTSSSIVYMAHRDDATGLWTGIPSTIDRARGTISGSVSHFSRVGPFSTTVGKITSAVLHVLEEWDKIKTGFTFHAKVKCSEPSEMWRMTADHPKMVVGCIERGPDDTDVVRLYNNEIYPQEVHLGHLPNSPYAANTNPRSGIQSCIALYCAAPACKVIRGNADWYKKSKIG